MSLGAQDVLALAAAAACALYLAWRGLRAASRLLSAARGEEGGGCGGGCGRSPGGPTSGASARPAEWVSFRQPAGSNGAAGRESDPGR